MASREQVVVSQQHLPSRWLAWLASHYSVAPLRAAAKKAAVEAASAKEAHPVHSVVLADATNEDPSTLRELARLPGVRLIGVLRHAKPPKGRGLPWFGWIPQDAPREVVQSALATAFENIRMAEREAAVRLELARTEREMRLLHEVGIALSAAHDSGAVLELILKKAREITGADAGSIYIVDERRTKDEDAPEFERVLRFQLSENESVPFHFRELMLPISESSIAGYVALHGTPLNLHDAYKLPAAAPYAFNRKLDESHGYRTRSALTLPMKNAKGEVIGVLQLINCKKNPATKLTSPKMVIRNVRPFPDRMLQMTLSLASQAAVSYENAKLYQDIEKLFEGFVKAAVTAIEQRDPTTSGHSQRVSTMTCGLAAAVDRVPKGIYASVRFTPEQMREIRYAALLHDFGKVAVREEVLIKAKKLYPWQLDIVEARFDYARRDLEARYQKCKLDAVMRAGPAHARAGAAFADAGGDSLPLDTEGEP
jgi:HD-GYP domain-containing protein (c-di-GMP phosphodiesterase class II)